MSKYSSDSNSRDRSRSYGRYFNQRQRSSSSSSTESSKHPRKHSSRTNSRYHKKSKRRHRSNSSSDCQPSRHKNSSRSYKKDNHYFKKKHKISSSSNESDNSNSSYKNNEPKVPDLNEKNKVSELNSTIQAGNSKDDNWVEKNVFDVMNRENSIELIKQEGFVFKIFKPSIEQKEDNIDDYDDTKLHEDIINSLSVEKSTFLISSRERLLNVRYKLLTKKERSNIWAKQLFSAFNEQSENG